MTTRRWLMRLLPAALVPMVVKGQDAFCYPGKAPAGGKLCDEPTKPTGEKFYITGLAHSATANDCTIPPIVAYGKDRIDALTHCCEGGGLTVWTESEWQEFQNRLGPAFEKMCADVRRTIK